MSRIIAGRFGGRRLRAPEGRDTRPTSDRVREALFSAVGSRVDLAGARFADLYSGSGAVGLEALSRGASYVLLVERDPKAARVARQNVQSVGAGSAEVEIITDRVDRVLAQPPAAPFDVVFADPPYALSEAELAAALNALVVSKWLGEDALVIVERSTRGPALEWVPCITADGARRYGETTLWYGRSS